MKKIFLSLLVLAAFSVSAAAQATKYTSAIVHESYLNINNTYPCPVANIDKDHSVAAVKVSATTTAFCMIDHSDFINSPLPTPVVPPAISADAAYFNFPSPIVDFTVNDLVVVDQYAFFCGTANGTWSFYGFFDINDLLAPLPSSMSVQFHMLSMGSTAAPATLNKLVAYKLGSSYKVVAIGDEENQPYNCISKIVEITDATGSPSCEVVNMPFFSFPNNVVHKIFLDDIVLTDNYVAIVGHDKFALGECNPILGTGYVWMSIGNKNNVINEICNLGLNPNYFLNNADEVVDAVIGEALDGDNFAIAYIHQYDTNVYTRLRVIDIPHRDNPYSQQFDKKEKENPVDMAFLKSTGMLELLQPIEHKSDFAKLDPYATTPYNTEMLNIKNQEFVSLDRIDPTGDFRFIATRNAMIYLQDRSFTMSINLNLCPDLYKLRIRIINKLPFDQYACPLISGTNNLNSMPLFFTTTNSTILKDCFSYE